MQKGQVFSLDFLIAMVAVTAGVGMLIQTVEVNTYYQKEAVTRNSLESIAETSADLIVASNTTTCQQGNVHLMNCIRSDIGIAELEDNIDNLMPQNDYGYLVTGFGGEVSKGNVQQRDFYEVKRSVRRNNADATLSVKVWAT